MSFTNISRVGMGKIVEVLDMEIDASKNKYTQLVPVIAGAPGIGKSATIKWLAEKRNMDWIIISLGALPYEYLSGLPEFQDTEYNGETVKAAKWSIPDIIDTINNRTLKALSEGKEGLLVLLDDIHLMEPAAQKYMFEFFQNKTLQQFKIHDDAVLIGAMNDSASAGLEDFYSAILDRISLYFVDFDFDFWYRNIGINLHPVIASYAKSNQESILGAESVNEVTASPRSWTELSQMLEFLENEKNIKLNDPEFNHFATIFAKGKIGTTESMKLQEFLISYTRFNFEKIFEENQTDYEVSNDYVESIIHAFMVRFINTKEHADTYIEILFNNKENSAFFNTSINETALLIQNISNIKDRKKQNVIKYLKSEIQKKRDPDVLTAFRDIMFV